MNASRIAFAVATIAVSVGLAACSSAEKALPETLVPTALQQTVTVTVAPTTATATATVEPDRESASAAKPSAAATPAATSELFAMPDLVGENLQLAQDKLQARGSYIVDQQDAAGLGRVQVLDSNWKVCAQSPKAGMQVPVETVVVLSSVKLSERCL